MQGVCEHLPRTTVPERSSTGLARAVSATTSSSLLFLATASTAQVSLISRIECWACRGGVHGLTRVTEGQLRRVPGVGSAKAAQILAAVELGRRTLSRAPAERTLFRSPQDVAAYLLPRYGAGAVEQFGVLMLDTKHRALRATVLSVGTIDASLVHPREVFRAAAVGGAAALVLFHNHPSGDPTPSMNDVALTERMVQAGTLMGIEVLDHVVLADVKYFSFKESGRI